MATTQQQAIDEYYKRDRFLEPFRRITEEWSVKTQHKFQERIRTLDLVASGDLENEWKVDVLAHDTGVVVAQFGFNEHGRYHDMRKVEYTGPLPVAQFFKWVESKIDKGDIQYSTLADKLGVGLDDPRVIHDLAYRIAKAPHFNYKRRKWYNKSKSQSVNSLYAELQEALLDIVSQSMSSEAQRAA